VFAVIRHLVFGRAAIIELVDDVLIFGSFAADVLIVLFWSGQGFPISVDSDHVPSLYPLHRRAELGTHRGWLAPRAEAGSPERAEARGAEAHSRAGTDESLIGCRRPRSPGIPGPTAAG
jgi:hypothetical protein